MWGSLCPLQFQRVRSWGPATSLHALAELLPVGESPIIIARALCRVVRRLFESETPHNSELLYLPKVVGRIFWSGTFTFFCRQNHTTYEKDRVSLEYTDGVANFIFFVSKCIWGILFAFRNSIR